MIKSLALSVAALALTAGVPAGAASAAGAGPVILAQANLTARVRSPGFTYSPRRVNDLRGGCKTVVTRERKGNTVVVRKTKTC